MRTKAEQTVNERRITAFFKERNRQKFALGFAHLTLFGVEVMHVEPIIAPLVTEGRLALRNFVGMVRKGVVDTAAVDVEVFAEELVGNAGALDVPTGVSDAEGGIPFEFLVLEL